MKHKTISLADQVFERLENDIISGKYQRGQILTELGLTEDLQVSRTPIREALQRLEQEQLIKNQPSPCLFCFQRPPTVEPGREACTPRRKFRHPVNLMWV